VALTTRATGVALIVLGGEQGSGCSLLIQPEDRARLAVMMRAVADDLDQTGDDPA